MGFLTGAEEKEEVVKPEYKDKIYFAEMFKNKRLSVTTINDLEYDELYLVGDDDTGIYVQQIDCAPSYFPYSSIAIVDEMGEE